MFFPKKLSSTIYGVSSNQDRRLTVSRSPKPHRNCSEVTEQAGGITRHDWG